MTYRHCNGQHDLLRIMIKPTGDPGVEHVTRWCQNCGAIVVDVDVDGRTQPGAGSSMNFPRITHAHNRGAQDTPATATRNRDEARRET
jgi:hypothetical protein